jgi:hypothetical protein
MHFDASRDVSVVVSAGLAGAARIGAKFEICESFTVGDWRWSDERRRAQNWFRHDVRVFCAGIRRLARWNKPVDDLIEFGVGAGRVLPGSRLGAGGCAAGVAKGQSKRGGISRNGGFWKLHFMSPSMACNRVVHDAGLS